MVSNIEFWMISVQPLWQMPPGDKVNLIDPRCKDFESSKDIVQIIPISVMFIVFRGFGVFG